MTYRQLLAFLFLLHFGQMIDSALAFNSTINLKQFSGESHLRQSKDKQQYERRLHDDRQYQQLAVRQKNQQKRGLQKRAIPPEYPTSSLPQCESFEKGDPDTKTLYSPGYPGNYPNKTDCVVKLEAPPGYLLRLDFRDSFHLEPSEDCKFDFLEIRDGGHGFSTLLGLYCGTEFPPMVTSKERSLWMRFHSDENIEYSGFVAVYDYIPRPTSSIYEDTSCRFEVDGDEGWVNRTDISPEKVQFNAEHNLPLDCMWVIRVDPNWKIQIAFLVFKLERPNDCDSNFVDVFGTHTDIPNRIKNFCGSIADSVTSKENVLHIRFYAEPPAINSTFSILFTAFHEKATGQSCEEDEYDCEDATCINGSLRCNGRVNCRFRWDEDECVTDTGGQSEHVIIVIVVFALILSAIFIAFLVSCFRKLIRDHKIIREHIRQSKESKLDEVGRYSTKLTDKQIQMTKLENLSVKFPQPPLSPDLRKEAISDEENQGEHPGRYGFRDMGPLMMKSSFDFKSPYGDVVDPKRTSNYELKHFHPIEYQASFPSNPGSEASGMCDTACQTRESLFQPIFRSGSKNQTPPGSQDKGMMMGGGECSHPRFSTFGYDQNNQPVHNSSSSNSSSLFSKPAKFAVATNIELDDLNVKNQQQQQHHQHHHHRHCEQHGGSGGGGKLVNNSFNNSKSLPRKNNNSPSLSRNNNSNNNDKKDILYSDIRKSAPDVIVMTSH